MGEKLLTGRAASSRWFAIIATAALTSLSAGQAMAACAMPDNRFHSPQGWLDRHASALSHDSIVGMWKYTFTSDGSAYPGPIPAGVEFDFGTQHLHSDGTEISVSGGRAPSTGDVCMGVWKRTGLRTYKISHIGQSWVSGDTPPPLGPVVPAAYLGPALIEQTITLDVTGNTYDGSFTIDQYGTDGATLLEHIGGTLKGTRMTAD